MYTILVIGGGGDHIADMLRESLAEHPLCAQVDVDNPTRYCGKYIGPQPLPWGVILERFPSYDIIFLPEYAYYPEHCPQFHVEAIEKFNKWPNTVIYSTTDQPILWKYGMERCLAYFKRSCNGWQRVPLPELTQGLIYPIDFGIIGAYTMVVPHDYYDNTGGRDFDIGCSNQFTYDSKENRGKLVQALRHSDHLPNFHYKKIALFYLSGHRVDGHSLFQKELTPSLEPNWWTTMLHLQRRCKVIVEAMCATNPSNLRTWEAHASGALVIREDSKIPIPNNFEDGKHVIWFETTGPHRDRNIDEAIEKAFYYSEDAHEGERRAIAEAGYEHAMKYHTSAARVDYMMNIIDQKLRER